MYAVFSANLATRALNEGVFSLRSKLKTPDSLGGGWGPEKLKNEVQRGHSSP
jgi:hypothetical protein